MRSAITLTTTVAFLLAASVGCQGTSDGSVAASSEVEPTQSPRIADIADPGAPAQLAPPTIELSVPFEEIAPWQGTVSAVAPDLPADLPVFVAVVDDPLVGLDALQGHFGVTGEPGLEEDFGGVWTVVDGNTHLYGFRDGAADLHALDVLDSLAPMTPMDDEELWRRSERLLSDLGLLEWGPVAMVPVRTGGQQIGEVAEDGGMTSVWTTHRSAYWGQRVEGLPTFGDGAETEIEFGRNAELASFSHCLRRLEELGRVAPDPASVAVERFLSRAAREGVWSVYTATMPPVESLEVTEVTLGYYVPAPDDEPVVMGPMYEIRGTFTGRAADGSQVLTDLLWYEPAIAGIGDADHRIQE